MSDGTTGPTGPGSSIPSDGVQDRGRTTQRPPTTTVQAQKRSPVTAGGQAASRRANPVEIVLGVVAAVALVLGGLALGLVLSRTGGTTSSTNFQQQTISTISAVDASVVQVQASSGGPRGGVGSGEILTSSGYIVTNSHVVHGFTTFTVLLSTGQTVPAQLVGEVPPQDLAVLKINASGLKPIAIADSSTVPVGEYVIAMGSPLGLEQSATTGIVSALNRQGTEVVDGNKYTLTGMIQTSAPINPGNSGGALINIQGQLVGIPTLAAVDPSTGVAANGIGFAISSNTMQSVIKPYMPSGG